MAEIKSGIVQRFDDERGYGFVAGYVDDSDELSDDWTMIHRDEMHSPEIQGDRVVFLRRAKREQREQWTPQVGDEVAYYEDPDTRRAIAWCPANVWDAVEDQLPDDDDDDEGLEDTYNLRDVGAALPL